MVVFSRSGGEGSDLPRSSFAETKGQTSAGMAYPTREQIESGDWVPVGGAGRETNPFEHYLEIDDNEKALLKALEEDPRFKDVVVILNSSNSMECDFLDDVKTYSKIRAGIWAQSTGNSHIAAIGDILKGTVNPSGRTPDIIEKDFTKDPTWQNYSNNLVGNEAGFDSGMGNQYTNEDTTLYKDYWDQGYYGVEYQEGIYNGYKYYETRGETDGEDWYLDNVQYPFGYGLSYTTFNWDVVSARPAKRMSLDKNDTIEVQVKVTNTGRVAGKDVVQLYYSAPYTKGGIEKSHVELGDFEKTGLLQPNQSETLTLSITARDMASYDCYDANKNGFKGYELEKGVYNLFVGKNSHSWAERSTTKLSYVVNDTIQYDKSSETGETIENRFDYISDEMKNKTLSRADWEGTFPSRPLWFDVENETTIDPLWEAEYKATHNGSAPDATVKPVYLKKGKARLVKSEDWLKNFELPLADKEKGKKESGQTFKIDPSYDENNEMYGGGKAPWYVENGPSFRDESQAYTSTNKAPIQLSDLMNTSIEDSKWDEFISQFTVKQAIEQIVTPFNFQANDALGMPVGAHADGNTGIRKVFDLIAYLQAGDRIESDKTVNDLNPTLLSSTFNKTLAYEYGNKTGDLALWQHVAGWYGPSTNLHRSHFSGRNSQYYSEDGVLSGKIVSKVTKGASDKGLITFMKHFALNDQESHRDITGVATWADEQTMRQNYLKPYEMAVKDGATMGMMTSFNRIGYEWAGASYKLLTQIARDEWNFKGIFITDAAGTDQAGNYMSADMMLRAGEDMSLDGFAGGYTPEKDTTGVPPAITGVSSNAEAMTGTQKAAIFNAAKRIAYVVSRSNAMLNGEGLQPLGYDESATDVKTRFGSVTNYDDIKKLEVKIGENVNLSVKDADLSNVKYVLYSGDLLGLTLNEATGEITGTVKDGIAAGEYKICIGAIKDTLANKDYWTTPDVNYFYLKVVA